jgi:dihydrofolate reductase
LYPDLAALRKTEMLQEAIANTGAVVMGRRAASTVQQCISSGLADELHLGIVPVLFGDGLRLFENLGDEPVRLETIRVLESAARTDIKYRVVR